MKKWSWRFFDAAAESRQAKRVKPFLMKEKTFHSMKIGRYAA